MLDPSLSLRTKGSNLNDSSGDKLHNLFSYEVATLFAGWGIARNDKRNNYVPITKVIVGEITVCSPQLGISPESNSGGEVYDREVLCHLAEKGMKIETFLPKNRPYPKIKNLKVCFAPIRPMFPPYIFNFFVFPYLINAFKKDNFKILRVHSPYFVGPAALLFKKFYPQIPLVASYLHLEEKSFFQPLLDRLLINKFDHIITISRFTKKEIINRYRVGNSKITVAYPGVSREFKRKKKNKQLLKRFNLVDKKVLLFLGGLKERKNPLFLLDVLKKLGKKDVVLLVAGEGSLKKKMVFETKRRGLKRRVVFTGFVKEKEKVDFYNLADVVLLPSNKEGFGMIAAEAQACGRQVIASNNSSLPEVVCDGKGGFLAETNDIDNWLGKIERLLDNDKLKEKMGRQAERYVRKKFSWEKNARIHLQVFRELL